MEKFTYPPEQQKRGASIKSMAVSCYILFSFFLLAGFWGMAFVPYVFAVLTAAFLLVLSYGVAFARAGKGTVEVMEEGLLWQYRKKNIFIPFAPAPAITFGGLWFKRLDVTAGGQTLSVYRTLAGYPDFWRALKARVAVPVLPTVDLKVRCLKTNGMGIFISAAALLLIAVIGVGSAYSAGLVPATSLVAALCLFGIVLIIIVLLALSRLGAVSFGQDNIVRSTPLKKRAYYAATLSGVALEQVKLRLLITGWRYRGPALPSQAAVSAVGTGLRIHIVSEAGKTLAIGETETGFPLEMLFDYISARYGLPDITA